MISKNFCYKIYPFGKVVNIFNGSKLFNKIHLISIYVYIVLKCQLSNDIINLFGYRNPERSCAVVKENLNIARQVCKLTRRSI